MAAIGCLAAVAGGTAYAANTVGSSDVINESLLSEDIKNGQIFAVDMRNDSVVARTVLNGSLGTDDIANSSLTGVDVENGTLTGSDILESSLSVGAMGCQTGKVLGRARIKGAGAMPSTYTIASSAVDRTHNCAGGTVEVRRAAEGRYFVRFNDMSATTALATSNSDGFGVQQSPIDNIVSISRITSGDDAGAFRVEVEDVNADGTDPQDDWFNIVVM
jgi:hypothetical protein